MRSILLTIDRLGRASIETAIPSPGFSVSASRRSINSAKATVDLSN
jgi:hypothetical protein